MRQKSEYRNQQEIVNSNIATEYKQGGNRRKNKIIELQEQFNDLKNKIKVLESNNQNMRIRINMQNQRNFKKKNYNTELYLKQQPIIHYQKKDSLQPDEYEWKKYSYTYENIEIPNNTPHLYPIIQREETSRRSQTPKNSFMREENGMKKSQENKFKNSCQECRKNSNNFNESLLQNQYYPTRYSIQNSGKQSLMMPQSSYQNKLPPKSVIKIVDQTNKLRQNLIQQRNRVQQLRSLIILKDSQIELLNNNLSMNNKYNIIGQYIDEFIQGYVNTRMKEIQRNCRKQQNRLKHLLLKINDEKEERASKRIVSQHRERRKLSNSRSKNMYNSGEIHVDRSKKLEEFQGEKSKKHSRSKLSQMDRSKADTVQNKEFQKIAFKYEDIIRSKNQDLEVMEKKLKDRDNEIRQLTIKISEFQIKKQNGISQREANQVDIGKAESNLLESFGGVMEYGLDYEREKNNQLKEKIKQLEKQVAQYKQNQKKNDFRNKFIQNVGSLEERLQQIEAEKEKLRVWNGQSKEQIILIEKKLLEVQCENQNLIIKINKNNQLIEAKDEKIAQLQGIFSRKNEQANVSDILNQSIMQNRQLTIQQSKQLIEDLEAMQRQLNGLKQLNYNQNIQIKKLQNRQNQIQRGYAKLKNQKKSLQTQNENLRMSLVTAKFGESVDTQSQIQNQERGSNEEKIQDQRGQSKVKQPEMQQLLQKYGSLQSNYKILNNKALEMQTQIIKLTGQVSYKSNQYREQEDKISKYRKENEQIKIRNIELEKQLRQKQSQLEREQKDNFVKIQNLQREWNNHQNQIKSNHDLSLGEFNDINTSRNQSEYSVLTARMNRDKILIEQNESIMQKLKQTQAALQAQILMEGKIIQQYKTNLNKVNKECRQKNKEIERLIRDNQEFQDKLRVIQNMQKKRINQSEDQVSNNRILQLEQQLYEAKDIYEKLAKVEHELFQQIKNKEEEKNQLLKMLENKNIRLHELQEMLEFREAKLGSNASYNPRHSKDMVFRSQSSLRYSTVSRELNERGIELELSQVGSSNMDNSQMMTSNISQMFQREQFPQKMKLRRGEQIKLFEKTAAYIKSLKASIEQKNKKIRVLQRKIQSLCNNEMIRNTKYIHEKEQSTLMDSIEYKDYFSLQDQYKNKHRKKYNQLQYDTKLLIQENNMLNTQIEALQEQIIKSEEQQNSLIKIKDLYKEEIKKLIKKNQQLTKNFQSQLLTERKKIQQSQSVHNMQAIRQLCTKIFDVINFIDDEKTKSKKKEEKRKQLKEYYKVLCNLLKTDLGWKEQKT